jgi:hypothetical protein
VEERKVATDLLSMTLRRGVACMLAGILAAGRSVHE